MTTRSLLFCATALTSAFAMFAIEPLLAKSLLPAFGGAPAMWNAALVFFQAALLLGYALAHVLSRLGAKRYAVVHAAWFALCGLALPLRLDASLVETWPPSLRVLVILVLGAGVPFVALSTNTPALTKHFSQLDHPAAQDPYFLVAASNVGSALALLAYPFAIEPFVPLSRQVQLFSYAYVALAILIAACALVVARAPARLEASPQRSEPTSWRQRLRWFAYAAIAAAYLTGVTQFITTDVTPAPLLWVVPLVLYLASFVLVFARKLRPRHATMCRVLPLPAAITAFTIVSETIRPAGMIVLLHLITFFLAALVCHGALADERPSAHGLTEFYLWMSAGGVGGGLVVALAAPALLDRNAEYPLVVLLALCMRFTASGRAADASARKLYAIDLAVAAAALALALASASITETTWLKAYWYLVALGVPVLAVYSALMRPARFALALCAVLAGAVAFLPFGRTLEHSRNFYGALRVMRDASGKRLQLFHGTTLHGAQSHEPGFQDVPLTYYHPSGPIGDVFKRHADAHAVDSRVAVVGLGTGSLAAYAMRGETWTFYEINPDVVRIALDPRYFTFLSDAFPGMHSARVDLGDARLGLARTSQRYAVLVVDAFTSDAIPVHLLTVEAMATYAARLQDDGLIAFHCSNNYLDLEPVLARLAQSAGFVAYVREDMQVSPELSKLGKSPSVWVAMARRAEHLGPLVRAPSWRNARPGTLAHAWTDDASSIVPVMRGWLH